MRYAVSSEQMKQIDNYTMQVMKIPALELMERAAEEVVAVMKKKIGKADRILAICGPGNNGGDGVAAGRILYLQGYHVAILFIGELDKVTDSMRTELQMARNLGIPFENSNKLPEYNIIIDAIFGVGLSRDISGVYESIMEEINRCDNMVYAVDIPSGISADTGKVLGNAVKANATITFGHNKLGLLLYPGAEYAGQVTVADIGFPDQATDHVKPDFVYYEPEDLLKLLPARAKNSHKGSYGKVLVVAGCKGVSGAAFFSAKAAYRSGAGLVKILTAEANRVILQTSLPEALFSAYDDADLGKEEIRKKIQEELEWASVIVIGPGLGQSQLAAELLEMVVQRSRVPIIIDADGINLLAKKLDLSLTDQINHSNDHASVETINQIEKTNSKKRLITLSNLLNDNIILTPHIMELSRLMGSTVSEISNNLIDTANQCSYNSNLIYTIKNARTIVVSNGKGYINVSGNHGMATGGSGDVLTGIIAALIAQGMLPFEATCLGVYVHGLAGDIAAKQWSTYSMIASDMIDSLGSVLLKSDSIYGTGRT